MRVRLRPRQAGVLVLAMQHAPGWTVAVSDSDEASRSAELLRVNRVLMGVALPPGDWLVEFRYRSPGVVAGAWLSLASWAALAVLLWRWRSGAGVKNG